MPKGKVVGLESRQRAKETREYVISGLVRESMYSGVQARFERLRHKRE